MQHVFSTPVPKMMYGKPMTGQNLFEYAKYLAKTNFPVMQDHFTTIMEEESLDKLKKLLSF